MGKEKSGWLKRPSKRTLALIGALMAVAIVCWLLFTQGFLGAAGGKKVDFKTVAKDNIPKAIETEVIPEYRDLERALGCLIDEKVYVIVTRGEKPTAGYGVSIESMELEKTNEGSNLKVKALFAEPEKGVAVSQVTTYPYCVASTSLTVLPDTIELIVEY